MTKWNLISAAAALSLAATPMAFAQQGSQQTNAARQSQVNNQRILQEQAQGTGANLMVSPAVVAQVKQALNQAGYTTGQVDGNWNKQAKRALRQYQQAQGLEPTGNLNLSTLLTMGIYQQNGGSQMSGGYGQQMQGGQMQGGSYGSQGTYGNTGTYGNSSGVYGTSSGSYGNSGNSGTGVGGSVGAGGTSVGGNVGTSGIGGDFGSNSGNNSGQSNGGNSGNNNPPRS
ncbi:MAG TPA: peptidoglycan-binding domain-containing protein [Gammaproteobacteria bacterium]|jgi:hypothetical protein|nr:peptidoglycan-binding domain-containing protein [Gammaproteobacteria bacterium]